MLSHRKLCASSAAARSPGRSGDSTRPVTLSTMASVRTPTSSATTATPHAIACNTVVGRGGLPRCACDNVGGAHQPRQFAVGYRAREMHPFRHARLGGKLLEVGPCLNVAGIGRGGLREHQLGARQPGKGADDHVEPVAPQWIRRHTQHTVEIPAGGRGADRGEAFHIHAAGQNGDPSPAAAQPGQRVDVGATLPGNPRRAARQEPGSTRSRPLSWGMPSGRRAAARPGSSARSVSAAAAPPVGRPARRATRRHARRRVGPRTLALQRGRPVPPHRS